MNHPPHVVVVGGGISGLAGAYRLRRLLGPAARITLIEQSARLGGAVHTAELDTTPFDLGAEAFLVRRPEATAVVRELGLDAELVHPQGAAPSVRAGGRTRPLPTRTVMGLPGQADAVSEVLSPDGRARVAAEPTAPLDWQAGADPAVGPLVRCRMGAELVDRLVDPLLGGVYAGRADALGLRSTLPAVASALDRGAGSLLAAARQALPPAPDRTGPAPVFGTLTGGLCRLVDALATASQAEIVVGVPVRRLEPSAQGWQLALGSAASTGTSRLCRADAVLLAVPPPALRRLLAEPVPPAAAAAGRIELSSSVVVGLALPLPVAQRLPAHSGVLIASGEPHTAKAFTFSSRKWAHLRGAGTLLVRASLGRADDAATLRRDDRDLVAAVRADLAALTGIHAAPVQSAVARWGGGLPQYAPGHTATVAELEGSVTATPGLAVAGAALHGVGIPACIATADDAAQRLAAHLGSVR